MRSREIVEDHNVDEDADQVSREIKDPRDNTNYSDDHHDDTLASFTRT